MYRNADVLQEHPFNVEFQGEKAIDFGGVARDVFNFFWLSLCVGKSREQQDGGTWLTMPSGSSVLH